MDLTEAIKAHSDWKLKLRSAISSQATLDAQSISKDDCCTLGKWLHGESRAQFGALPSHTDCVRRHAEFHKEAGRVAATINARKYPEAEKMLGSGTPYALASNGVVIAIGALKKQAKL